MVPQQVIKCKGVSFLPPEMSPEFRCKYGFNHFKNNILNNTFTHLNKFFRLKQILSHLHFNPIISITQACTPKIDPFHTIQ